MTTRSRGIATLFAIGALALSIGVWSAFGWQYWLIVFGAICLSLGWSAL